MRLAHRLVVPTIVRPNPLNRPSVGVARETGAMPAAHAHARGFTLIELLVVIVLISILAALAIPASGNARADRHVFEDAGSIAELFRQARARSISRGAATLVVATTNGTTDLGTFLMYESVLPGTYKPINTCRTPSTWNLANPILANGLNYVTGANLNGVIESQIGLQTSFSTFSNLSATATGNPVSFAICYTPLGQAYFQSGVASSTVVFDGSLPMTGSVQISVQRTVSGIAGNTPLGLTRTVVIPPNGMARVAIAKP